VAPKHLKLGGAQTGNIVFGEVLNANFFGLCLNSPGKNLIWLKTQQNQLIGAETLNSAPGAEEGSLCQCRDLTLATLRQPS
jgi:hypothetical protein